MVATQHEIERIGVEFEAAFNRGDMAAIAAFYEEDGLLMPPESPIISGHAAIQTYWEAASAAGMRDPRLNHLQIDEAGDVVVDVGTATADSDAGPLTIKYIAVWKRQLDGGWLMSADVWNFTP